jgi:hypothetical protein
MTIAPTVIALLLLVNSLNAAAGRDLLGAHGLVQKTSPSPQQCRRPIVHSGQPLTKMGGLAGDMFPLMVLQGPAARDKQDCIPSTPKPNNPLDAARWYQIHVVNKLQHTSVTVAIRYKVQGDWRGEGPWKLLPGDAVFVAITDDPVHVVYAITSDGNELRGACDSTTEFNMRGPGTKDTACTVCGRPYPITTSSPCTLTHVFDHPLIPGAMGP